MRVGGYVHIVAVTLGVVGAVEARYAMVVRTTQDSS